MDPRPPSEHSDVVAFVHVLSQMVNSVSRGGLGGGLSGDGGGVGAFGRPHAPNDNEPSVVILRCGQSESVAYLQIDLGFPSVSR